jgi:hypothetical protein
VPQRSSHLLLRNESRHVIMPLLTDVEALRRAYDSAPATMEHCDELVRRISGRLGTAAVSRPLDLLLRDEHQRGLTGSPIKISGADLKDEIELASDFGYSDKEVKRYVQRVRGQGRPATHRADIATTEDLVRELKALHDRAAQRMAAAGPPVQRLRHPIKHARWQAAIKSAREYAQYGLYCVGTIIADGMSRDLFETSYALGSSGLEHEEASVVNE